MYNTYMNHDLAEKLYSLQKNVLELHNLFDLNMVANQSRTIEDLLSKVGFLVKSSLGLKNIRFFLLNNGIFQTKNIVSDSDMDFEFDAENAPFLQSGSDDIIKVTNQEGIIYKAFWNTYKLHELQAEYLKIFSNEIQAFCVCSISKKEDGSDFSEDDFRYINQVFTCVEPIMRKFIQTKEQETKIIELNKTLHNLSILYNISQAVNFIDDLKRLISVILDKAIETVNAEKGSLMLYDPSDNTLQVKVVYGLKDKKHEDDINNGLVECQKMKPESGIAGKVFTEKKSIITNLGGQDPRFNKFSDDSNVSSLICVPLIAKGECIGIINITNKKNGKLFNKKDLEFVEALANQAAIAVDNAQLYELATKDGLTKLYIHRHFYFLLESEIKSRKVRIEEDERGFIISLGADQYFESASTNLVDNQSNVETFIKLASSSSPIEIKIRTINTKEIAEPRLGLYVLPKNCISIRSPIKIFEPPPSILDIIKVLTAGTKTIVIPDITPGKLSGANTLRNTLRLPAPRSCAASTIRLSIFTIAA